MMNLSAVLSFWSVAVAIYTPGDRPSVDRLSPLHITDEAIRFPERL